MDREARCAAVHAVTKSQTHDWATELVWADYSHVQLFVTPVPYGLLKFAQVHVHCINDAIQTYPLMPSSTLNLSQH